MAKAVATALLLLMLLMVLSAPRSAGSVRSRAGADMRGGGESWGGGDWSLTDADGRGQGGEYGEEGGQYVDGYEDELTEEEIEALYATAEADNPEGGGSSRAMSPTEAREYFTLGDCSFSPARLDLGPGKEGTIIFRGTPACTLAPLLAVHRFSCHHVPA